MSEDVSSKVKKIVADHLGIDEAKVTEESSFIDDLGADSLDTVELVMAFEEEFGSEISDSEAEKILTSTKEQISNEKMKALTELKNQVASLSIEMSEKVLKSELSDAAKQKEFVSNSLKQSELN
mgnify:CR=1 FL=1